MLVHHIKSIQNLRGDTASLTLGQPAIWAFRRMIEILLQVPKLVIFHGYVDIVLHWRTPAISPEMDAHNVMIGPSVEQIIN